MKINFLFKVGFAVIAFALFSPLQAMMEEIETTNTTPCKKVKIKIINTTPCRTILAGRRGSALNTYQEYTLTHDNRTPVTIQVNLEEDVLVIPDLREQFSTQYDRESGQWERVLVPQMSKEESPKLGWLSGGNYFVPLGSLDPSEKGFTLDVYALDSSPFLINIGLFPDFWAPVTS